MKPHKVAVLLTAGILLAGDAAAAEAKKDNIEVDIKRLFGLRKSGKSHLQMRPLQAPVVRSKKSSRIIYSPVTPIVTVSDGSKAGTVCKLGPRINDALLQVWHRDPIPLSYMFNPARRGNKTVVQRKKDTATLQQDTKLIAAINEAIGRPWVSGVMIVLGARSTGGGTQARLPFSSVLGCAELESPMKKKKKDKDAEAEKDTN